MGLPDCHGSTGFAVVNVVVAGGRESAWVMVSAVVKMFGLQGPFSIGVLWTWRIVRIFAVGGM